MNTSPIGTRHTKEIVGDYVDQATDADLSSESCHSGGDQGGQRSHPHGNEGGLPGSAQGDRRLGELPGHDDRASGCLGVAEHRSKAYQSRVDHFRALRDGLPCHLLRRVGEWAGGLRPGRLPVGIQPDDDRGRTFRRRRHHWRCRPQVLFGILRGRPDRREGGGQLRERPGQGPCLRSARPSTKN